MTERYSCILYGGWLGIMKYLFVFLILMAGCTSQDERLAPSIISTLERLSARIDYMKHEIRLLERRIRELETDTPTPEIQQLQIQVQYLMERLKK